jgi:3-methyladenine DNA glycosylase AlkC
VNHLNAISKNHPRIVLKIAENWFGKNKKYQLN